MKRILEDLRNLSDEKFREAYPELTRVVPKSGIMQLFCADPEFIALFVCSLFENGPRPTRYRNCDGYMYKDGTRALFVTSQKCYKFYYYKELIAILNLI